MRYGRTVLALQADWLIGLVAVDWLMDLLTADWMIALRTEG